jgi:hypothetical protein
MVSVRDQLDLKYVPFDELIVQRRSRPGRHPAHSDFYWLARSLGTSSAVSRAECD